ncbi:alpha/beta fold hydrolase [Konateibacter massiliensis]|uniref:alpha/beta fold hydrolase n=1 Tax=Konateibacter massiliensis TaxID=2002841 RepID=UPI000C15DBA5|nr:alpha/beta hydrolase [Konateibacter massiliensis]
MLFRETGDFNLPTIILLHGGGLSDWSWDKVAEILKSKYHIVMPVIDGHGDDGYTEFTSIEESAKKVIWYIDEKLGGKVFAIGGLSIGAQITAEVLSIRNDITEFAILESALVCPIKGTTMLTVPTYKLLYGLIKRRWFSRIQAKSLCVPEYDFERYYHDSLRMSRQTLINITLSNGNYELKDSITNTSAKVLIIVGSKEIRIMKKSAELLHSKIKRNQLYIAQGMKHGELSLIYTEKYIERLNALFAKRAY